MKLENVQLTENFWLKEFIEGSAMSAEAIKIIYEEIEPAKLARVGVLAAELQKLRDKAKSEFGDRFKGLNITCGIRPEKWEKMRGRSGKSQHTQYWAADFTPICDPSDFEEVFNWLFEELADFNGGVAINKRTKFIHLDLRGTKARWEY